MPKCGGTGCHDQEPAGGVDMTSEEIAFTTLQEKVVPGSPDSSILWQRLNPETCQAPCRTMPLDRPLLPDADRQRIRQWILDGALRR